MPNTQHPPLANPQHLTLITQNPPLAITFCDICMPEAFCEFETVRKKVLLDLWVLWEEKTPNVRGKNFQRVRKNSPTCEKDVIKIGERICLVVIWVILYQYEKHLQNTTR